MLNGYAADVKTAYSYPKLFALGHILIRVLSLISVNIYHGVNQHAIVTLMFGFLYCVIFIPPMICINCESLSNQVIFLLIFMNSIIESRLSDRHFTLIDHSSESVSNKISKYDIALLACLINTYLKKRYQKYLFTTILFILSRPLFLDQ